MSLGMLGKYERLSILGRGVSGIVYLAKDTLLNRQVALKEVDVQAGDLRRFLEEARVMDRLKHPNIVRVNGVDRIEDKVVIDMEYVRGKNLQEILRVEGPFAVDRAIDIGIQLLSALEYAHSMQTVHRDIKPANILIDRDGAVKLADFGLAEILATNAYACGAGTYAYMAPEDFLEENHSDNQSDIWAVAVTLFEMMTGERPFRVTNAKSPFAWKRALETQEPTYILELVPTASAQLAAVIARGLARDKDRRYLTATTFRQDLLRVRAGDEALEAPLIDPTVADPFGGTFTTFGVGTMPMEAMRSGDDTVWNRETSATTSRVPYAGAGEAAVRFAPQIPLANVPIQVSQAKDKRKGLLGFKSKTSVPRLQLSMERVDFGSVRKGEDRQVKMNARVINYRGPVNARISSAPSWVIVSPQVFDSARQAITVIAQTDRCPAIDRIEDTIEFQSDAGVISLPVRVNVLKPRPTFRQVALWFVPLFGCALAPALITATVGVNHQELFPPAATSSLALAIMLFFVSVGADLGIGEKLACGILGAGMCFVLGTEVSVANHAGYNQVRGNGFAMAGFIGFVLGLLLLVQLITSRRWKFWGFVLGCVGVLLSGVCYNVAIS